MAHIRAVIFDLDDTLYPERAYAFSGFDAVATAFEDRLGDRTEAAAAMQRLFDTEDRRRVFNALLAQLGLPEDRQLIRRMIGVYREHRPTITLHRDADAALTRLRGRHSLGLITDGPPASQWAKIDALGLRPRLDEIIVSGELGPDHAKPHPRPFELMSQRLAVEASGCAYVADNPAKDFIAPNALGWVTIRIERHDGIYRNIAASESGSPSTAIDTLDALDAILRASYPVDQDEPFGGAGR
jgi:putative hydrolase of the HAD superfamily